MQPVSRPSDWHKLSVAWSDEDGGLSHCLVLCETRWGAADLERCERGGDILLARCGRSESGLSAAFRPHAVCHK